MNELKRELKGQKKTIAMLEKYLKNELAATKTLIEINMETVSRNIKIVDNRQEAQFNELKGYINNGPRNVQQFHKKQASNGKYTRTLTSRGRIIA